MIDWVLNLGKKYNVNPYLFAALYLGAIPFFILSLRWTIHSIRRRKSLILPIILTVLTFKAAYIYVLIAARNVPLWVYIVLSGIIIFAAITTFLKIKDETQ
jgi:hypothetical protein